MSNPVSKLFAGTSPLPAAKSSDGLEENNDSVQLKSIGSLFARTYPESLIPDHDSGYQMHVKIPNHDPGYKIRQPGDKVVAFTGEKRNKNVIEGGEIVTLWQGMEEVERVVEIEEAVEIEEEEADDSWLTPEYFEDIRCKPTLSNISNTEILEYQEENCVLTPELYRCCPPRTYRQGIWTSSDPELAESIRQLDKDMGKRTYGPQKK